MRRDNSWLDNATLDQLYRERDNLYEMFTKCEEGEALLYETAVRSILRSILDDIVDIEIEIDRRTINVKTDV